GTIILSTTPLPATAINLGGNVKINAKAPPHVIAGVLDSLDFTDPSVVSLVLTLQSQGFVGGALLVSGGIAVGGNAIISPTLLAPTLKAENIPANVTLTASGFQSVNPINLSLTEIGRAHV